MTDKQKEIIRKFRELVNIPVQQIPGVVIKVNDDDTVDVTPVTGPDLFDVRLKASIDEGEDGIVITPALESSVLVAIIGNDPDTATVVKWSEIDKIRGKIGDTTFEISTNGVVINGGNNGGLINIQTLIEELAKTNDVVTTIVDSLTGWTPVANDGGAALKTHFGGAISGKEVGDFSNMEDEKVKH